MSEKFEEISREFREINKHIVSCAEDTNQDTSLGQLLNLEADTLGDMRVRSNKIVSQLLENWTESERLLEKKGRDWASTHESYKLEIEKLKNEKEEACTEIAQEWQGKLSEKEEDVEALALELDKKEKESERIKMEMEKLKINLGNEKNDLTVVKDGLLEQLSETSLKLREKEQQLTSLEEQFEKATRYNKDLGEEKQKVLSSNEKLELSVSQAKEEIDRLQLDIEVLQNERNHYEERFIESTKHNDYQFMKLYEILGNELEVTDVEHVKAVLPKLLSDAVRQLQKCSEVEENLKEEKAKVCNQIREEFEAALVEKESILDELREKLKKTHSEYDEIMQKNEDQTRKIKSLQEQISSLHEELQRAKPGAALDTSGDDRTDGIETPAVVDEDLIKPHVVEEVMAATSSDSLMVEFGAADYEKQPPKTTNLDDLETLNKQLESLTRDKESLQEQLESLQVLYIERNAQVALLADENDKLKDLAHSTSASNSNLMETNETLQREIRHLRLANESNPSVNEVKEDIGGLTAANSSKDQLKVLSLRVTQLEAELSEASKDRAAYVKLRRDFDHIVSGLRGDLERVMADRNNISKMLDNLRAQVHEGDITVSQVDRSAHDKSDDTQQGPSLKEVQMELENSKHQLREMTLVNRQLKQLGKSLDAELKETRKDKQQSEKNCQDLRDEMEAYVKEKEAIIVESRERIETSEKLHQDKVNEIIAQHLVELEKAAERSEFKELSTAHEELQMKLNDAYEEINNIGQLEEINIALKQEIDGLKNDNEVLAQHAEEMQNTLQETEKRTEILKVENKILTDKIEDLKSLVDEAYQQIERRDEQISKLNKSAKERKENVSSESGTVMEAKTRDVILPDVVSPMWREPEEKQLLKAVNAFELVQKPAEVIEYRAEVTSESEKLERELIQTSSDVSKSQIKLLKDDLEREGIERRYVAEQLNKEREERATALQELEKAKKISQKLKSALKNARSENETLNESLSETKADVLEKEQTMTALRNEMSEIVLEKEEVLKSLLAKVKDVEQKGDENMCNLKSEYQEILKQRDGEIEKLNEDLRDSMSRSDELKGQLDMWRQSYEEVREKGYALDSEVENLRHSLQVVDEELQRNKEISASELSKERESINELNEQLRFVFEGKANSDRMRSEVEDSLALAKKDFEEAITQKDSVIESLRAELKTANEQLDVISDDFESQKRSYEDSLGQIEEDRIKYMNLQNELNTSANEKDSIIVQLEDDLKTANESLRNFSLKLQERTDQYQNVLTLQDSLAEQLKEARDQSESLRIVNEGIIFETGQNLEIANSRAEGLSKQLNENLSVLESERKRKEELDDISSNLRKDLDLRTEQKRELEVVVMALNVDLEKALRDREELRQALRVKQTVTQATDNPRFDEIAIGEKTRETIAVQQQLSNVERQLGSVNEELVLVRKAKASLEDELRAADVNLHESLSNAQNEKKRLEEVISSLNADLQQSSSTKEEAINVLRKKLEEAVEERGGAVASLRNEYDKMLAEKDQLIASLQDEIQRVNEEFTNLGYRFELTLQDNISKGNNIMQLQNQVQEKEEVLKDNRALQERLNVVKERVNELENEIHELTEDINRRNSEKVELENSLNKVAELEKQLAVNVKEHEASKAKQKKEFKRLYEGLLFDLENSRKQNLEKEKSLKNLRDELEEIMEQKEALALKIRSPGKENNVERLQKSGGDDFVENFRVEKKELLRDLDKTRQEKDEIFAKFHSISEGLRRDLEAAINSRDERTQECLNANVVIDKLQRTTAELEQEIRERDATIKSLNSGIQAKSTESSNTVEQFRSENQKLKSALAQESMKAREAIVNVQNINEELRQSLAKAEYDRENLRNYVASKEVQNEELKRKLNKEISERKRLAEKVLVGPVEEEIFSSSAQETRIDLDEVRTEIF